MMKKLLYIFACAAAVLMSACSKSEDITEEGKGAVSFTFPTTRAAVSEEVYSMMKFRIYSHDANGEQTLVRLYTYDEIKDMKLWLVAGSYSIAVEGGVKSAASFTDVYYQGSTPFDLAAGEQKSVAVTCNPKNTLIKVVFDESVTAKLENAAAIISIDDVFSVENIASGAAPSLTYTQTAVGYYMIEEGKTSFAWNFSGKVTQKNTTIDKIGLYTPAGGFKEGAMYTITFKYSDDLGGYITMDVTVDETVTDIESDIIFKPEPQITGPALDAAMRVYAGMESLVYDVKAITDLSTLSISVGEQTYTYTSGGDNSAIANYFTIEQVTEGSNLNWTLTLGDELLTSVAAGNQKVSIVAADVEGVEGEVDVLFFGEGTCAMEVLDAWNATATLKAYVNDSAASDVVIYYREVGVEEWSVAAATLSSDNIYQATAAGVDGGRQYEYYLSYDNEQKGVSATFTTGGMQIPNAGMEEWSGSTPLLPYISTQWWDSGNHGSATMSKNVTTNSTDIRPGSTGQYSAYLKSQFVGVGGIGKFAAGNIFFGTYLGTSGTNGTIGFGQPFAYDYKPKKLVLWYKGAVGTCDHAGGSVSKGDSDKNQIYVWLCNWTGQHAVNTADSSTFIDPVNTATTAEGNIIGYGEWNRVISSTDDGSDSGWVKLEIPITYREGEGFDDVKPNYLVISCAASGYGDYFAGSTKSYMYVDDFELVY